jgi:hypothetical protein
MITQTDNGGKSHYQVLETIIEQQRFIMRVSELDALLERLEQIKSVSTEERKKLFDLAIQLAPIGSWTI